jgi:hypothetical protein
VAVTPTPCRDFDANVIGAEPYYLGGNIDGVELRVNFMNQNKNDLFMKKKIKNG